MSITDAALRRIRAEVGTTPSDDALAEAYDNAIADGYAERVAWAAAAAQVLGERLADAVAGSPSISIPGAISIGASPSQNVTALRAQLDRLRGIAGGAGQGPTGGRLSGPMRRSILDGPAGYRI